ncbi:MAG: ROK family transcriptional regulator [Spirochaetaceae bacterium]|nr:MAG: ROK family transcriptional regulator [Spirochaetaceae bacterium]
MTGNNFLPSASRTVHLSDLNKRRVVDVLLESEQFSRRELAARTNLANSTISTITTELIEEGLVRRIGKRGQSSAGRREEIVARNPRAVTVIGVHYTTDACTFGLIDFGLGIVEEFGIPRDDYDPEHIDEAIVRGIDQLLEHHRLERNVLGVILSLPNNPVREQVVTSRVSERLDIPVFGINNVTAMAVYYNYVRSRAIGDTFSLVYVGTGIGSGLVIRGEAYHGVNGNASDLGHLFIRESSSTCRCGLTGCLETFSSLDAIARRVADQFPQAGLLKGDQLVDFLEKKLWAGDRFVEELIDSTCADLARGIRNLVAILDPGTILVVSRLNRLNPFYEGRLRDHFYAGLAAPTVQTTRLEFGEYHPEAGIVGASLYLFRTLLGGTGSSRVE